MHHRSRGVVAEHRQGPEDDADSEDPEAAQRQRPLGAVRRAAAAPDEHREGGQQEEAQRRHQVVEEVGPDFAQEAGRVAGGEIVDGGADVVEPGAAAEDRDQVLALVVQRAAKPGRLVGVDDRRQRAAVVDPGETGQLVLDQPVAGRLPEALVGRPGQGEEEEGESRRRDPAPSRKAPEGGDDRQRHRAEDAAAVGEDRERQQGREERRTPGPAADLLPQRGQDERRRRQQQRRRQQLRPDVEPVDDRDPAGQDRDRHQGAGQTPEPRGDQQRPEPHDPELLQDDAEDLVVAGLGFEPEQALGEDVAGLQRRSVAGQPARRQNRVAGMAVGEEPVGEVGGDQVVARQRTVEAGGGHRQRVVDAAMQEAEEDEEGGGERPEGRGDGELAQEAAIDARRQRPDHRGSRGEDREVGEGFTEGAVAVIGPEGEQGDESADEEGEGQQQRDRVDSATRGEQGGGGTGEAREQEVRQEQSEQLDDQCFGPGIGAPSCHRRGRLPGSA